MTASNNTRSQSDNSTPRLLRAGAVTVERDPRTRRIVTHAHNYAGATTTRDIASETGWTLDETRTHLERLERENYVQLIGEPGHEIVLLTHRGEGLATGEA